MRIFLLMRNGDIHLYVCERGCTTLAQLIVRIIPTPPIEEGDLDGMYRRAMRYLGGK